MNLKGLVVALSLVCSQFEAAVGDVIPPNFIQWQLSDGGNGHWYRYVDDNPLNWADAQAYSVSLGGHLVTITSAEEQQFITTFVPDTAPSWLGGFQNKESPLYEEPAGGWEWVTGEQWEYTNWHTDGPAPPEPTNATPGEDVLSIHGNPIRTYKWNDARGISQRSFIVEISAVPEPTGVVAIAGLVGVAFVCRTVRRRKRTRS